MDTNAQVALNAAALVHQPTAAGSGAGGIKHFAARPETVLSTADMFLDWLNRQDTL